MPVKESVVSKEPNGADVGIEAFGMKANVKNVKSLNTALTFFGVVGVTLILYIAYQHSARAENDHNKIVDAVNQSGERTVGALRESNATIADVLRSQVEATKDQTRATRYQNCIIVFPQADRASKAEYCKQLSK